MNEIHRNSAPLSVSNDAGNPSLHRLPSRAPVSVPPSASLRDTLYRMNQTREDAAVIVDEASNLPLGLVTLRDLVHVISFEGGELDAPVAGFMTAAPLTIPADAPPHRAKVLMAKRSVRHLLLVDGTGRLTGIISQADLFGPRAADADDLVAYLRQLNTGSKPQETAVLEPVIQFESSYDLQQTLENLKQAVVGRNFRVIREQYFEQGLAAEGEENTRRIMLYFCNFSFLDEALAIDPRVGLFLPCRITLVETGNGVQVMSINPKNLSQLFNNQELDKACQQMHDLYEEIMEESTL